MKKLVLKKDVVARINGREMNQLRGGVDTYNVCQTMPGAHATCTAARTCEPNIGCGGANTSGHETCGNTGGFTGGGTTGALTCNGDMTCNICGLTHVESQCDTCYIRCTY